MLNIDAPKALIDTDFWILAIRDRTKIKSLRFSIWGFRVIPLGAKSLTY